MRDEAPATYRLIGIAEYYAGFLKRNQEGTLNINPQKKAYELFKDLRTLSSPRRTCLR
jgi:hypothetical protein